MMKFKPEQRHGPKNLNQVLIHFGKDDVLLQQEVIAVATRLGLPKSEFVKQCVRYAMANMEDKS